MAKYSLTCWLSDLATLSNLSKPFFDSAKTNEKPIRRNVGESVIVALTPMS